jgi:hypothetical protein
MMSVVVSFPEYRGYANYKSTNKITGDDNFIIMQLDVCMLLLGILILNPT